MLLPFLPLPGDRDRYDRELSRDAERAERAIAQHRERTAIARAARRRTRRRWRVVRALANTTTT